MPSFGENLQRLRKAARLKGKDIADRLGVARSVVSGWQNDRRGLPETPTLFKLAKVLNCSVEDLLEGVDQEYEAAAVKRRAEATARLKHSNLDEPQGISNMNAGLGLLDEARDADQNARVARTIRDVRAHNEADELDEDVSIYERENIPIIQEGEASPHGLVYDADAKALREIEDFTSRPAGYRERGAYAIVLIGDSMEPLLKRGMRLIVSPNVPVGDGDLSYAQLRSGERLIKIATKANGGWLLTSANPAYPPRSVKHDEIEYLHRVAYVRFLK